MFNAGNVAALEDTWQQFAALGVHRLSGGWPE